MLLGVWTRPDHAPTLGIVLREAGRRWDNDSVERIGQIISDVSGFSSTLLRPDGRLDNGIVGAIVVTATHAR